MKRILLIVASINLTFLLCALVACGGISDNDANAQSNKNSYLTNPYTKVNAIELLSIDDSKLNYIALEAGDGGKIVISNQNEIKEFINELKTISFIPSDKTGLTLGYLLTFSWQEDEKTSKESIAIEGSDANYKGNYYQIVLNDNPMDINAALNSKIDKMWNLNGRSEALTRLITADFSEIDSINISSDNTALELKKTAEPEKFNQVIELLKKLNVKQIQKATAEKPLIYLSLNMTDSNKSISFSISGKQINLAENYWYEITNSDFDFNFFNTNISQYFEKN